MKNKGMIQEEGIVSARLMVDMDALWTILDNGGRTTHEVMAGIGFTSEAVAKLMQGGYNKICSSNNGMVASLYTYDGYETTEGLVMLYVLQGGEGYRLAWNKDAGTWLVTQVTVGNSYSVTSASEEI